jgi:hypothetical protein
LAGSVRAAQRRTLEPVAYYDCENTRALAAAGRHREHHDSHRGNGAMEVTLSTPQLVVRACLVVFCAIAIVGGSLQMALGQPQTTARLDKFTASWRVCTVAWRHLRLGGDHGRGERRSSI